MKKYIILFGALPLLFASCLKEDKDLFSESASARIQRVQTETEAVLNAAPNGWQMKYYPSSTQQYGGIMLYMKFDSGKVTVASERGGKGETAQSLYSYDSDAGATLNFDTYNPLFHIYSEPNSGVGETNTGMDGDAEFVIVSYSPEEVVLRGKRTLNTIRLTPLPAGDWTEQMKAYTDAVAKMEKMLSYSLRISGTTYEMYRKEDADYPSRYLCVVDSAGNTIEAPYIYTNTGIEFYRPLVIDGTTIENFDWSNERFINVKCNALIAPVKSNMTLKITINEPEESDVSYKVSPENLDTKSEYYYSGYFKASVIDALDSDEAVIRYLLERISSTSQLATRSKSYSITNLKAETDYYVLAIGVAMSSGKTFYPLTELRREAFKTAKATPYTEDYAAWLGTWTVTSTGSYSYENDSESDDPISFDIRIEPLKSNSSYEIYGWGISFYRNEYPLIAKFNAANGSFGLTNNQVIQTLRSGSLLALSMCRYDGGYTFFGDKSELITVKPGSSSGTGIAEGKKGTLSNNQSYQVLFCDYFLEDEYGDLYLLAAAEGYTSFVYPIGPYTLTKKADLSASGDSSATQQAPMRKMTVKKEMFYQK